MKTHIFEKMSSGRVYDETQVSGDVHFGDILIVPSEKIVGFMVGAWPCAVTKNHGSFHCRDPKLSWVNCCNKWNIDHIDYHSRLILAHAEAVSRGWEID